MASLGTNELIKKWLLLNIVISFIYVTAMIVTVQFWSIISLLLIKKKKKQSFVDRCLSHHCVCRCAGTYDRHTDDYQVRFIYFFIFLTFFILLRHFEYFITKNMLFWKWTARFCVLWIYWCSCKSDICIWYVVVVWSLTPTRCLWDLKEILTCGSPIKIGPQTTSS